MPRAAPRHDRDAGGPADVLAAKAALRQEVWSAMRAARVARFPGAAGRIPNFTGAEAAAERLRGLPAWQKAAAMRAPMVPAPNTAPFSIRCFISASQMLRSERRGYRTGNPRSTESPCNRQVRYSVL